MKSEVIKNNPENELEDPTLVEVKDFGFIAIINSTMDDTCATIIYSSNSDYELGERIYINDFNYTEFHGEIKITN